ncbi:DUF6691 family protein [Maritimibacter sp. HL-12]|uniref:DUF6691 family protein n=1 Tax=Maritimibacter sp. HL-12 TaxID=1162418 RepID=UPI000A0F18A9|nr:DUF6691 family protein [Maritimibacter sp. HL-12]SMH57546.1 hypothetical protein SAMN05661107_3443 [Maritimibacter sp. HL-12]
MHLVAIYLAGLLFGLGISISGMVNPAKTLNFFDVAGGWDASLAVVMVTALAVAAGGYRLVLRRSAPLFAPRFQLPTARAIDARLVLGAGLFGIGWGMSGFCPGASLPALGTGRVEVFAFTGALVAGMFTARWLMRLNATRAATVSA